MAHTSDLRRRDLLRFAAASGTAVALARVLPGGFGAAAWAVPPPGYDGAPGPLGLRLPKGFKARIVAISGTRVASSGYEWHIFPDGGATFADGKGGWYLVSNSEATAGGAGAIHFNPSGSIVDAYSVLKGTMRNCAGGPTPWGTWLSGEEHGDGLIWECDPSRPSTGKAVASLGKFKHEAAAVDPIHETVYLTEDETDGLLYRFRPDAYPDLSSGLLEAAVVTGDNLSWLTVPNPGGGAANPTRYQVVGATPFPGGEGIWYQDGQIVFATKGDNRVHLIDTADQTYSVLYDAAASGGPLTGVDNVTIHPTTGNVLVAEDGGDLELVWVRPNGDTVPFLQLTGDDHAISELAGPCFTPDGSRLYFSSQRGTHSSAPGPFQGITYEITGPFDGQTLKTAPTVLSAMTAQRLVDTRSDRSDRIIADKTIELEIAGRGDIPTNADAAVINLTATEPERPGYITAWPTGQPRPLSSALNIDRVPQTVANLAVLPLGRGGTLSLYSQSNIELVVDALGFFTQADGPTRGGRIVTLAPFRLFDTRPDQPTNVIKGLVGGSNVLRVKASGVGSIPAKGVSAVVLNITATGGIDSSFVTVWPTGQARPLASNLNFARGETAANTAIVPLGDGGQIDFYSQADTFLLADVVAYVTAESAAPGTEGQFVPLRPRRLFDTRTTSKPAPNSTFSHRIPGNAGVPRSGVAGVIFNLTATESTNAGYITAWPGTRTRPHTSSLNLNGANETRANTVIMALSKNGDISFYTQAGAHLLADVTGYLIR